MHLPPGPLVDRSPGRLFSYSAEDSSSSGSSPSASSSSSSSSSNGSAESSTSSSVSPAVSSAFRGFLHDSRGKPGSFLGGQSLGLEVFRTNAFRPRNPCGSQQGIVARKDADFTHGDVLGLGARYPRQGRKPAPTLVSGLQRFKTMGHQAVIVAHCIQVFADHGLRSDLQQGSACAIVRRGQCLVELRFAGHGLRLRDRRQRRAALKLPLRPGISPGSARGAIRWKPNQAP